MVNGIELLLFEVTVSNLDLGPQNLISDTSEGYTPEQECNEKLHFSASAVKLLRV